MGFSVSGAMVVILIGMFVAFGLLFPAVVDGIERVGDAQSDRSDRILERMNTDMEVVDTQSTGGGYFELEVENTGSTPIQLSTLDVIIDGEYTLGYTTEINDRGTDTDYWYPGEILIIAEEDADTTGNPDRYKLVTATGISVSGEL